MGRNRKNQSGSIRFGPALKAVLLCLFIGGSAVGYVLQKNKLHELGSQIKKREVLLERLKWDNNLRTAQLAKSQMPQKLMERVKELNLGLVPSQMSQCVTLLEPSVLERTNRAPNVLVVAAGK